MDVAMAIASSMNELNEKMKDKSFKSMFVSGMNIGKDSIGTMANTLILAYIGCSMSTVLLLFSYNLYLNYKKKLIHYLLYLLLLLFLIYLYFLLI